jgi:hypothetical protein
MSLKYYRDRLIRRQNERNKDTELDPFKPNEQASLSESDHVRSSASVLSTESNLYRSFMIHSRVEAKF